MPGDVYSYSKIIFQLMLAGSPPASYPFNAGMFGMDGSPMCNHGAKNKTMVFCFNISALWDFSCRGALVGNM
jgi:hypothetical protein